MAKEKKVEPKAELPAPAATSAKSSTHYLRISPRKLRLTVNTVRRKPVAQAFPILGIQKNKGARLIEKVLKSAVANAKVLGMDETKLYIAEIRADGGPALKRFRPRAMGRADRILKRMSHLSMVVKEGEKSWGKQPETQVSEAASGKGKATKTKAAGKKKAAKAGAKA